MARRRRHDVFRLEPHAAPGIVGGIEQISAGGAHTCAVDVSGQLRCWGYGDVLRPSDPEDLFVPEWFASGIAQVSAGSNHTCVRKPIGEVQCWGWNGYYGLGDGTAVPSDAFAATASYFASTVSAGGGHTCVVAALPVAYPAGAGTSSVRPEAPGFVTVLTSSCQARGGRRQRGFGTRCTRTYFGAVVLGQQLLRPDRRWHAARFRNSGHVMGSDRAGRGRGAYLRDDLPEVWCWDTTPPRARRRDHTDR